MANDVEVAETFRAIASILYGFREASEPEPEHFFIEGQGLLFIGPCAHCQEGYVIMLPATCPVCSVELRRLVAPFWSATPRRLALHLRWGKLYRAVSERIPLWLKISYEVGCDLASDMYKMRKGLA